MKKINQINEDNNNSFLHSTEYCRKMLEIFPIVHCKWNIVAKFLLNIPKYFITSILQFSEIVLTKKKFLIVLEIL